MSPPAASPDDAEAPSPGMATGRAAGRAAGAAAWADALQALRLFATDPAGFGGMAVRAGHGPVRSRFLELLRQALPPDRPVRTIAPHIGDDRLLGGLDLPATLAARRPVAQSGVLAEADGGIIILTMAERAEPAVATRLQAVLDTGTVSLQRDGLSSIIPARFGVVALDEGDGPDERLCPGLLDRLAFHLDLTHVSLRDVMWEAAADAGWISRPAMPRASCPEAEAAPDHRAATDALDRVSVPDPIACLVHLAAALGIDSPRTCVLALRAARVAALTAGCSAVSEADLALAARLVLAPRATCLPAPPDAQPPPAEPPPAEPPPEAMPEAMSEPAAEPSQADGAPDTLPDEALAEMVLAAVAAALPPDLLDPLSQPSAHRTGRTPGRAGQARISFARGRPIGCRRGTPGNGARLHLLETLKAAAPWQSLRGRTDRFQVRRDDLRIVRFRQKLGTTTIFAVDASGSAALHRLAEAKGAVELLLADCYVRRDQVALIAFRGHEATLLLPPTGSLLRAKRSLAALPGGGATPLAAGLEAAMRLADMVQRGGRMPVIALLTDARANVGRNGSPGRPQAEADALAAAKALGATGVAALVVDTSPRPNPFARTLADMMRARYVPLPHAQADIVSRAVRDAAA